MTYVASIVRDGIEQGRQEERQEGLIHLLECRFGKVPENYREHIAQKDIKFWISRALAAHTLAEVFEEF